MNLLDPVDLDGPATIDDLRAHLELELRILLNDMLADP